MKWLHPKPVPIEGQLRSIFPFAWKPTQVERYKVWLERYWAQQQYIRGEWVEIDRGFPIYY